MISVFVAFFLVAVLAIFANGRKLLDYYVFVRRIRRLPRISPHRFILGNSYEFWTNPNFTEYYQSMTRETENKGGMAVLWISYYPILLITSWKHTPRILGNRKFLSRGWPSKKLTGGFNGLISLEDSRWKAHRALISPSFSPKILDSFIPTLIKYTQNIVADLEKSRGKIIDPMPIFEHHIISILLETSLGLNDEMNDEERLDLKSCMKNLINSNIDFITQSFILLACKKTLLKLSGWIRSEESDKRKFIRYAMRIIKFRLSKFHGKRDDTSYETQRNRDRAFLDSLLSSQIDQTGKDSIDYRWLINELANIMEASYETIIISTLWFLYNMSNNPDIQEKLFEELFDFDESNESMTASQINELKFLDQCVRENLRIHPPVACLSRRISEEIEINGYSIPAGTLTATSIYSIHHDGKIYPDPEQFDPSRFDPDNITKIPPGAYIPFGDGPRRCIGERLGLLESKIILSSIIKNFRIITSKENNVKVKIDLRTTFMNPVKFYFIPRSS
ncbi:cytochrome P450 4C1-like [Brevipalpus obovatus]|uniref:cytochrome P450 4C1-like n=1 Tax=Brevipalpus obovatus TaxID=246614 RepID=UPI003D9DD7A6